MRHSQRQDRTIVMNLVKGAVTLVPVVALTGVVVVGIAVSLALASWELL